MRALPDASAYALLRRGHGEVAGLVRRAEEVLFSAIVVGELMYGFRRGTHFERNAADLRSFLDSPYSSFVEVGPEHRITLGQMMERLNEDTALEVAATVNTKENVRIAFDYKVEQVIQEIVDQNFDLYKRIADDPAFGEAIKNHLFDQYLRRNRSDRDSGN